MHSKYSSGKYRATGANVSSCVHVGMERSYYIWKRDLWYPEHVGLRGGLSRLETQCSAFVLIAGLYLVSLRSTVAHPGAPIMTQEIRRKTKHPWQFMSNSSVNKLPSFLKIVMAFGPSVNCCGPTISDCGVHSQNVRVCCIRHLQFSASLQQNLSEKWFSDLVLLILNIRWLMVHPCLSGECLVFLVRRDIIHVSLAARIFSCGTYLNTKRQRNRFVLVPVWFEKVAEISWAVFAWNNQFVSVSVSESI